MFYFVVNHVWDQLFTVDTILNIGETGDINELSWDIYQKKSKYDEWVSGRRSIKIDKDSVRALTWQ